VFICWSYSKINRSFFGPLCTLVPCLKTGKRRNMTPHRIKPPKPIAKQIVMADQVREETHCARSMHSLQGSWPFFNNHSFYMCLQVRPHDGSWRTIHQNMRNHARLKPLGLKWLNLTYTPCFRPKMLKFGPKSGLGNFLIKSLNNGCSSVNYA